jgi:hypothetical protein
MLRIWMCVLLAHAALAADAVFDLAGHLHPEERASVTLFGDAFPFTASTLSDPDGRFRFQKLRPGAYTIAVFVPERGEARQTIEVGPSGADAHGRVSLDISFKATDFELADTLRRRHSVSVAQLTIPARAQRDYEEARKDLARHDADAARSAFFAKLPRSGRLPWPGRFFVPNPIQRIRGAGPRQFPSGATAWREPALCRSPPGRRIPCYRLLALPADLWGRHSHSAGPKTQI